MSTFFTATLPEVFVLKDTISKSVLKAADRAQLRKIGPRLYTRNLTEPPERLVRRNWCYLITGYYPDALIADRTALENQPSEDGSVFLVSGRKRATYLPGVVFRPRGGCGALDADKPFMGGARLSSAARAFLDNLTPWPRRAGRTPRTLSREEIEMRLDSMIARQGPDAIKRLRDEARRIAPQLGREQEFERLDGIINTLLGIQITELQSPAGRARAAAHGI